MIGPLSLTVEWVPFTGYFILYWLWLIADEKIYEKNKKILKLKAAKTFYAGFPVGGDSLHPINQC